MAKPTKEEASAYIHLLTLAEGERINLSSADVASLRRFLERVRSALPTNAAVQRDRERRKRPDPETCPGCHCSPSECACAQADPE